MLQPTYLTAFHVYCLLTFRAAMKCLHIGQSLGNLSVMVQRSPASFVSTSTLLLVVKFRYLSFLSLLSAAYGKPTSIVFRW